MRFFANLHQLSDWGLLALRVGVGMSFWVHGTAKRAMWKMAPSPQMPAGLLSTLRLLSIVEPLGAVAAFAGFLMQPAAAGFVIIMLGAIRLKAVQMHRGFSADGGWELRIPSPRLDNLQRSPANLQYSARSAGLRGRTWSKSSRRSGKGRTDAGLRQIRVVFHSRYQFLWIPVRHRLMATTRIAG